MNEAIRRLRKEFGGPVAGISPLILGNCPHLQDLATPSLVALSQRAECRLVHGGEQLFDQGATADSAFLLLDGVVRLEHTAADGTVSAYEVIGPYVTFGDLALLGEERRRYTATASEDSVVVELPIRPLIEVLNANPRQALAWRGAIMARLYRKEPAAAASLPWRILGKLSQLFEAA